MNIAQNEAATVSLTRLTRSTEEQKRTAKQAPKCTKVHQEYERN